MSTHRETIACVDELLAVIERVRALAPDLELETTLPGMHDAAREAKRDASRRIRAVIDQPAPAATEATECEKTTRVFAALHRSAEQDVSRVITLYEQWVQAGPPPLGASMARWWDARLAELHKAILPPVREQKDRPTHPDGTPYQYAEIVAEGWGYCDGCRTWSTGTPERPHQCPQTHIHGPSTAAIKEK
ncbi:hypothetical protein ACH419_39405 [Streptomyces bobili]|uniref:hypothetical protein n=1 Tax=Streptomyces bobili TaxID=67280 RepID=UPI003789C67D